MSFDTKDFILLEHLAGIDGPAEMSEESLPREMRANFTFFSGTGDPDNIYARLPRLESYGLIKFVNGTYWQITDEGRKKLVGFISQLRAENEAQRKEAARREAEYKLALSTLGASENHKKPAKENRLLAIINIIIGCINIGLLIWLLVKTLQ